MEKNGYKTTFAKEVELKMPDYISASFLQEIAELITQRVPSESFKVELSLSTDAGADFSTSSWDALENILKEAKKYNRKVGTIHLNTGIVHRDKESGTHYSVTLRIQRLRGQYCGFLRAYAVAGSTDDSQHVIDWGAGLINDFEQLSLDDKDLKQGMIVINAKDGSVQDYTRDSLLTHATPQKVEVVNPVNIVPPKWSDKVVILTIISIAVAIVIGVISLVAAHQQ